MMIPLALVIVAVHSYLNPKTEVAHAEPNTEVLRQALEKTSETVLEEPRTETATLRIERAVNDPAAEGVMNRGAFEGIRRICDGNGDGEVAHPNPRCEAREFLKAADPEGKADPAGSQLIEITLTKKKP